MSDRIDPPVRFRRREMPPWFTLAVALGLFGVWTLGVLTLRWLGL